MVSSAFMDVMRGRSVRTANSMQNSNPMENNVSGGDDEWRQIFPSWFISLAEWLGLVERSDQ